jgi:hypothetical protein
VAVGGCTIFAHKGGPEESWLLEAAAEGFKERKCFVMNLENIGCPRTTIVNGVLRKEFYESCSAHYANTTKEYTVQEWTVHVILIGC